MIKLNNFSLPNQLLIFFNNNSKRIKDKFFKKLLSIPSQTDGLGYVYGFSDPRDRRLDNDFWIKIGRTEKNNPIDRIDEWGGKVSFCIETNFNKKLERLLHLFFNYCNEQRTSTKIEIEWFHFKEKINLVKIVSIINEIMEENTLAEYFSKSLNLQEINPHYNQKIEKININSASKKDLMTLPFIGERLATAIINHRKQTKFYKISDILNVNYIGNFTFKSIESRIIC